VIVINRRLRGLTLAYGPYLALGASIELLLSAASQ